MIAQLRQSLRALERPAGFETERRQPAASASRQSTRRSAAVWRAARCTRSRRRARPTSPRRPGLRWGWQRVGQARVFWIAEDMALTESGAPYGPGLDAFALAPERLLTVAAAHRRDLLWAMEEALRCRAVAAVIGELRHGEIDMVAMRRLSLAAADKRRAGAAVARGAGERGLHRRHALDRRRGAFVAAAHGSGPPRFAAHLMRNRRGPTGSWILEWSDNDERFLLATHAQPVAAPALDRPHRKVA